MTSPRFAARGALVGAVLLAGSAFAAPGDLDPSFGEGGRVRFGFGGGSDAGRHVAQQLDGKIVVAAQIANGLYTEIGLARYLPDGTLDTSFGEQGFVRTAIRPSLNATQRGDDFVSGLMVTADKIVVAGLGRAVGWGTGNDFVMARYDLNGVLDPTFDGDGKVITDFYGDYDECHAMTMQPDGKILLAGIVVSGGDSDFGVARYLTDGSLDPSFGGGDGKVNVSIGTGDQARGIGVQSDGKIVVTGFANVAPSTEAVAIIRLLSDGTPDPSWDFDGKLTRNISGSSGFECGLVVAMQTPLVLPQKIVIAGIVLNQMFVLRYNQDGTPDNTFDGDGLVIVPGTTFAGAGGIAFTSSGGNPTRILVSGDNGGGAAAPVVIKLDLNGAYDGTFGGGDGIAEAPILGGGGQGLALAAGARPVVVGRVSVGGQNDLAVARLDSNGAPDPTFDGDGWNSHDLGNAPARATAVVHQPNGKILVAGTARIGGIDRFALARLDPIGRLDPSFDGDGRVITMIGDVSSRGNAIVLQPDGRTVVAGTAQVNGPPVLSHFAAARYDKLGALDPSFAGTGTTTIAVYGFADGRAATRQDDGKIVIAGSTQFGGNANFALVRLDTLGVPDPLFDGDGRISTEMGSLADTARAVIVRPDGVVFVAGSALVSGTPEFAAASYGGNGGLDVSFSGDGKVMTSVDFWADHAYACAIQASAGRVVLAGQSFGFKSEGNFGLLRYDIFGDPDPTFGGAGTGTLVLPVSNGSSGGRAVSVLPDGRFLVAGWARPSGTASDFAVVRFLPDGENDETFATGGAAVVDVRLGSDDTGNAISADPFGRAVVAGEAGGVFGVVRLLGDTGLTDVGDLPAGAPVVRLALVGAHPCTGPALFALDLPRAAAAELDVFDVRGARVRTLLRGELPAGRHRLEWDGLDDAGRAVAPGVYFARAASEGTIQVARVVRVRG